MKILEKNQNNTITALSQVELPEGISIRLFEEGDFTSIQKLYEKEGWITIIKRPDEGLEAWKNSYPALVVVYENRIIGVLRALSDRQITTYIIELLINEEFRGKGLGKSLIDACHLLCPRTRLEVLATKTSNQFYESYGFRKFYGLRKSYY